MDTLIRYRFAALSRVPVRRTRRALLYVACRRTATQDRTIRRPAANDGTVRRIPVRRIPAGRPAGRGSERLAQAGRWLGRLWRRLRDLF